MKRLIGDCWDSILINVGKVDSNFLVKNKAQSCPNCGGDDRYQYLGINKYNHQYDGSYLCRGCGAGDGFSLLIKMLSLPYADVKNLVLNHLGIEIPDNNFIADFKELTPEKVFDGLSYDKRNQHPYLIAKKINLDELNVKDVALYRNRLAIPAYELLDGFTTRNTASTYELISTDGTKLSLKGRSRTNCIYRVGDKIGKRIYLCEGFSTALSLHKLSGDVCVCCFGVTNLPNVLNQMMKYIANCTTFIKVPSIVVACDNDPAGLKLSNDIYDFYMRSNLRNLSCILPKQNNTDFSDLYVANSDKVISELLDEITILFRV